MDGNQLELDPARHRGDELLSVGTQPEQPEQPWVQGGATLLVLQASAQHITLDTGSLRSKMHRSKVAKGARWWQAVKEAEEQGQVGPDGEPLRPWDERFLRRQRP